MQRLWPGRWRVGLSLLQELVDGAALPPRLVSNRTEQTEEDMVSIVCKPQRITKSTTYRLVVFLDPSKSVEDRRTVDLERGIPNQQACIHPCLLAEGTRQRP